VVSCVVSWRRRSVVTCVHGESLLVHAGRLSSRLRFIAFAVSPSAGVARGSCPLRWSAHRAASASLSDHQSIAWGWGRSYLVVKVPYKRLRRTPQARQTHSELHAICPSAVGPEVSMAAGLCHGVSPHVTFVSSCLRQCLALQFALPLRAISETSDIRS